MPDATAWKEKAVTLRQSATQHGNPLERQTLLTLAEDCEAIAVALESQAQPGKPKPSGNSPRPPAREGPTPIQEPPRPTPPPPVEPPPVTAQKAQRPR